MPLPPGLVPYVLGELDPEIAGRVMMLDLSARLSQQAIAAANESDRLRKAWKFGAAWKANGRCHAYLEAAEHIFAIAQQL